jgi:hypothetical protein
VKQVVNIAKINNLANSNWMEWYNECNSKMDYSIDLINSYGDV